MMEKSFVKNHYVKMMLDNIEKVMVGKREAAQLTLIALLAKGHVLLEDVPGVGKTTLAKSVAQSMQCGFGRIQFTPDTLPSDITGLSIYNMKSGMFEFQQGAVMNNIILADEINRTSPKTQASLLEAMEENQVTVDGNTYELPAPFMVIATQNPVDSLGTYNLPEAQLDRFLLKISIGYPSKGDEKLLVHRFIQGDTKQKLSAVVDANTILEMQREVEQVSIHKDLISYIVDITDRTRKNSNILLG